jgi:hypothetical protein
MTTRERRIEEVRQWESGEKKPTDDGWVNAPERLPSFTQQQKTLAVGVFSNREIELATRTSRGRGAVGMRAIVPRLVAEMATREDAILDFGCGKDALHARKLRERFLNVTPYDFESEFSDPNALKRKYSLVYASNVLNVQVNEDMLHETIKQLKKVVAEGGRVIANYPASPRKIKRMNGKKLLGILLEHFVSVEIIHGTMSVPVFEMRCS